MIIQAYPIPVHGSQKRVARVGIEPAVLRKTLSEGGGYTPKLKVPCGD